MLAEVQHDCTAWGSGRQVLRGAVGRANTKEAESIHEYEIARWGLEVSSSKRWNPEEISVEEIHPS